MARENVEAWARSVQISPPVHWGALEEEILSCEPPEPPDHVVAGPVARAAGALIRYIVLPLGCIPVFGVAFVGAALIAWGAAPVWINLAYFLAILVSWSILMIWRDDRERGPVRLFVVGATGAASLLAYLLFPDAAIEGWTALLVLASAAAAFIVFVIILVASNRTKSRQRRRRWSLDPIKDNRYLLAREKALDILAERGQISLDEEERWQMLEMPLGAWRELDRSE